MGLATAAHHSSSTAIAPFPARAHLDQKTMIVKVAGEIDLATAPALETSMRRFEGRYHRIRYELDEVTFIDCSGLRALLAPAKGSHFDGRVTIASASRSVQRLLELLEMEQIVEA